MAITPFHLAANPITPVSNPDQFAPNATLITFAGLPVFSQPKNVDGVGLILANGSGPDVAFDPSPPREFGPSEATIIQNIVSRYLDLNMNFLGKIDQLGFDMRTFASETIDLTFTSGGQTVESLNFPTRNTTSTPDSPLLFYGFESTVPFDHVLLDVSGPNAGFFEIDNLTFTSVPESAKTWSLLLIGLSLCGFARKKLRAH